MIVRYYLKYEPRPRTYLRLIGCTQLDVPTCQYLLDTVTSNHNNNETTAGGYIELSSWKVIESDGTEYYRAGTLDEVDIPSGAIRQKAVRRFNINKATANKIKTIILQEEQDHET